LVRNTLRLFITRLPTGELLGIVQNETPILSPKQALAETSFATGTKNHPTLTARAWARYGFCEGVVVLKLRGRIRMSLFWKRFVLGFVAIAMISGLSVGLLARDSEPAKLPLAVPHAIPPADTEPGVEAVVPVQALEPVRPEAAVTLEWSGPPTVRLNKANAYTLTVKNVSSQPLQKMTVQVRAAKGAKIDSKKPAVAAMDGVYLWEIPTLDVKQSKDFAILVTPTLPGETGCQAWVTFTGTSAMKVQVLSPEVKVEIMAPEKAVIGDTVVVHYTIRNQGNCPLDNLQVSMSGLEKTAKTLLIPQLKAGETKTHIETIRAATGGIMPFGVSVNHSECTPVSASAKTQVLVPQLKLTMTGPKESLVNRPTNYTLRVQNTGEVRVKDLRVTLKEPAGWNLKESGWATMCDRLPTELAPGGIAEIQFGVRPAVTGTANWQAEATGDHQTRAMADCVTVVQGISALRMELVDLVDPVEKGHETTYEIRVTNTGTQADSNIVISCPLPEQVKFIRASGPTNHTVTDLNQCAMVKFDPVRELAPKTEAVYRIVVRTTQVGDIRFKAQMNSQTLTTSVVKEESTRIYGE
jgi:uncharacterized repeat protein (TIGR01451 family)